MLGRISVYSVEVPSKWLLQTLVVGWDRENCQHGPSLWGRARLGRARWGRARLGGMKVG